MLYKNNEIFNYIEKSKSKELFHSVISNIFDLSKNPKNKEYMKLLLLYISDQIEIKLNHEFLSYLMDLLLQKLKEIISTENSNIVIHTLFLKNLIFYSEDKKQLKDKLTNILKEIMKFLYNHYKSKKKNTNEKALFLLIDIILKNERLNKYEIFGNDEIFYFKDYLNKFESIEEIKLNKKIEKFKNIVENIESNKENKFISIEELNKLISTKEENTKENQDKFLKLIIIYCYKYLKSKNENNKEI